ncbi:MAG: hypothetical protein KF819_40970 [Labilithrix sp.]|nr:hypothetical protein [Labilithrix sp.]
MKRSRTLGERALDVPQRVFERLLSGEARIAATGLVRYVKQVLRSRAIDRELASAAKRTPH